MNLNSNGHLLCIGAHSHTSLLLFCYQMSHSGQSAVPLTSLDAASLPANAVRQEMDEAYGATHRNTTHSETSLTPQMTAALSSTLPFAMSVPLPETNMSYTVAAALSAILCGAVFGYNLAIVSGISRPMIHIWFSQEPPVLQRALKGIFVGSLLLGAAFGSYLGVYLAKEVGRIRALLTAGLMNFVSCILLLTVHAYEVTIVFRFILGIAVGICSSVCPLYISEIVQPTVRGQMGTLFQIFITVFILIAMIVNYLVDQFGSQNHVMWNGFIQLGLGAIPGICLFIVAWCLPESEVWLQHQAEIKRRQQEQAQQSFEDRYITEQNAEVVADIEQPAPEQPAVISHSKLREYCNRENMGQMLLAIALAATSQLTGINVAILYSPIIFDSVGGGEYTLLMTFMVVGLWNVISVLLSIPLVDRFVRKYMMLSAIGIMFVGYLMLGLNYSVVPAGSPRAAVAIVGLLLVIFGYEIGIGGVFWVLVAEVFLSHAKQRGLAVATIFVWIFTVVVGVCTPVLFGAVGVAGTFYLFAVFNALLLAVDWLLVPVTTSRETPALDENALLGWGDDQPHPAALPVPTLALPPAACTNPQALTAHAILTRHNNQHFPAITHPAAITPSFHH